MTKCNAHVYHRALAKGGFIRFEKRPGSPCTCTQPADAGPPPRVKGAILLVHPDECMEAPYFAAVAALETWAREAKRNLWSLATETGWIAITVVDPGYPAGSRQLSQFHHTQGNWDCEMAS